MRLPSGQPLLQNGMPQSMHRLAWRSSVVGGEVLVDLVPVQDAHRHRPAARQLALVLQEALDVTHVTSSPQTRAASMTASIDVAPLGLGPGGRLEHPLVVVRHDLAELVAARRPSRRADARPPAEPVSSTCRDDHVGAGTRGPRRRARSSATISVLTRSGSRRRRRARRRCRPTCRRRSCARSGRARRPARRSCTRSRGRPRPRRPPWRRSCGRRTARPPRPAGRPRRRWRRRGSRCRR